MMTLRNSGRLAIHRRSDEMAFLQHRLRALSAVRASREVDEPGEGALQAGPQDERIQRDELGETHDLEFDALIRERDLADELLHTRQTEPLGETLQRRLAMAERICRDLALRAGPLGRPPDGPGDPATAEQNSRVDPVNDQDRLSYAYRVAEIERQALAEMLNQWWVWLRKS
jgi:hypothetical protein